jgi:hypothetical protein
MFATTLVGTVDGVNNDSVNALRHFPFSTAEGQSMRSNGAPPRATIPSSAEV